MRFEVSTGNRKPYSAPDDRGRFGEFGGRFVAETLTHALDELTELYENLSTDEAFRLRFEHDLAHYVGRPTPLYEARRLTDKIGGARIFLKREDLNHTANFLVPSNHRVELALPGPLDQVDTIFL